MPSGGWLRAAAGTAFLHGMSNVMLSCAGLSVVTALTSLRYLPGRDPGRRPATRYATMNG